MDATKSRKSVPARRLHHRAPTGAAITTRRSSLWQQVRPHDADLVLRAPRRRVAGRVGDQRCRPSLALDRCASSARNTRSFMSTSPRARAGAPVAHRLRRKQTFRDIFFGPTLLSSVHDGVRLPLSASDAAADVAGGTIDVVSTRRAAVPGPWPTDPPGESKIALEVRSPGPYGRADVLVNHKNPSDWRMSPDTKPVRCRQSCVWPRPAQPGRARSALAITFRRGDPRSRRAPAG
jgi:hypothetical protein